LLIVITLIGIMTAMAIPSAQPATGDQLRAGANVMLADLDFARSLAIANDSKYRVSFDVAGNRYLLTHSGSDSSLDQLPSPLFPSADDTSTQQVTRFDDLPNLRSTSVILLGAATTGTTSTMLSDVEFGPLGQTTQTETTVIWLTAGAGAAQRYISLQINPVTGLVSVGAILKALPSGLPGGLIIAMDSGNDWKFARQATIEARAS